MIFNLMLCDTIAFLQHPRYRFAQTRTRGARFKFPACCGRKIARKNFEALIFGPFDLSKRTPNSYKICQKLLRINKLLEIKNNAKMNYML